MTKSLPFALAAALGLMAGPAPAAPALGDKPVRYEYAELQCSHLLRAAGQPGAAGGKGGVPVVPQTAIKWITADEEIEATEWEDLANKLKAPASKKDGASVTQHKLRVLNRLGADGWEIVEHTGTDGMSGRAAWVLRRRVP